MSLVNTERIMEVLSALSVHEDLKVTVTESAKGAAIAGSCAFVGGLVAGPVGLGLGGSIGAIAAASKSKQFKPVAHVIMYDLTPSQRESLCNSLIQAFKNIKGTDMLLLLSMVMTDDSIKNVALDVLKTFLASNGYSL